MFVCPECGSAYPGAGVCPADGNPLGSNLADPLLGQTIGSFRVAQLIGVGGMGRVYKGVHPGIGSRVAIKILNEQCAAQPPLVDRFFSEARAVNLIRHESIVNVTDLAYLPDRRPYIVMEFLEGAPLSAVMKTRGPLPVGGFTRLLQEVLSALQSAHQSGVVHRDLKPDNIFVSPGGRATVLDFGVAKLRPELSSLSDATRTGSLLGTPHYMSPEQAQGQVADARSDIYSVGVILYEGLTGQRPFSGTNLYELLKAQVETQAPSLRLVRPDLIPAYEAVVLRALEKDPNYRYQSALELSQALTHVAAHLPPASWENLGAVAAQLSGQPDSCASLPVESAAQHHSGVSPTIDSQSLQGVPASQLSTHPGVTAHSTASAASEPKSGCLPYIVGSAGALALVGILAVLAVVGLYFIGVSNRTSTAKLGPVVTPAVGFSRSKPSGFNAKKQPITTFLPQAEILARKHFSDAKLVSLHAWGVDKNGTIDLTKSRRHALLYTFHSTSKSGELNCTAYVHVNQAGVRSYMPPASVCKPTVSRKPSCSLKQVFAKSSGITSPHKDIHFQSHGSHGQWTVVGGASSQQLPDGC